MPLTRRAFARTALAAPLAAPLAATLPTAAKAGGHAATAGAALYDAPLGSYRITAILDGIAQLGRPFFFGADEAEIDAALADIGVGPDLLPGPVNAYLLQSDDRTILIDAGMGEIEILGPGFGRLGAGLAAMGVAPGDIDTVIITHLHVDHIGGMLMGGAPVFPNAEIVVAEADVAFWTDPGIAAQAPEEAQGLFQLAMGIMAAYGDAVTQVGDGAEVAPGLTLELSPGHTPGHSVIRIDGGDQQLLMIADTVHSADLHLLLPDTGFGFDTDPAQAAASRRRLFDMAAADKMLIAGSHVHFPGFGRILPAGDAYRFAPATWV
ncbi:MAG: MBL fold metallo-hydrolase [Pseudomonadota bacterium]